MAEKKPRTMDAVIGEFLADVEKMPPEERADIYQAFFDKYLKPRWNEMSPTMKQALPQVMATVSFPEDLQAGQRPGFSERVGERRGLESMNRFIDMLGGGSKVKSAANVASAPMIPIHALAEGIDTAVYDVPRAAGSLVGGLVGKPDLLQRYQRPVNTGGWLNMTPGQQAEHAIFTVPKLWGMAMRSPYLLAQVLGKLKSGYFGMERDFAASQAAAAVENALSRLPQQRALPPRGGTYGAQGPFPMPPSSLPPQPPMHAPRPPSLMPQPRAGGDIGPKLIRGPKGEVYLDPEG